MLNATNILNVKVTTNTSAEFDLDVIVTVDSHLYKIDIDDPGTIASNTGNVVIYIKNTGLFNVTLDAVYINNTFISLTEFIITSYTIGTSNPIQLTISMTNLEAIIGAVNVGDKLDILVRTKEGAEDTHVETVRT